MVRSHCIIQDTGPEPLLSLEEPLKLLSPIPNESQEELFLMASMSDVPHTARNVISVSSSHLRILLRGPILPPKTPF